jgi:hypothetical protein
MSFEDQVEGCSHRIDLAEELMGAAQTTADSGEAPGRTQKYLCAVHLGVGDH